MASPPSESVPGSHQLPPSALPLDGTAEQDASTASWPRAASWPENNPAAFAQNAHLPHAAPRNASASPAKASERRKPSDAGLSLQTSVEPPSSSPPHHVSTAAATVVSPPNDHTAKHRPAPLQPTRDLFNPYHQRNTSTGSPASTASSPALTALNDVTPLPSPINPSPSPSPDPWKRLSGRPLSSSSASLERERPTSAFLSPTISATSPAKSKVYPQLGPDTPPGPQPQQQQQQQQQHNLQTSHDHNRSISEYIPEPLQNVRLRTVTGPSVVTQPAPHLLSHDLDSAAHLQREAYLARERGSVDLTPGAATASLPSPPPSNVGISDEEENAIKKSQHPLPLLILKDHLSGKDVSWQPLRILGTGSFSEVFLAAPVDASSPDAMEASLPHHATRPLRPLAAIKFVSHHSGNDEQRMDTSIKREIEILKSMRHPCLPQLYGFEDNDTRALLVMNYCAGGDLFELASQHRHLLQPPLIQRIIAELVAAVTYLHSQYIVHRDIKLENVLLNLPLSALRSLPPDPSSYPHPLITLTDLGLAKHIPAPPASPLLTHPCGSVDYAAPEILLGQPYDGRATDAWALGVLLYALMEGRLPFDPPPEPPPGSVNGAGAAAARRRRARAAASSVKHRIARCDWLWCEFGDEDGEWLAGGAARARELEGARECVEGLLKKAGRGRWALERVAATAWVGGGIRVPGGLRVGDADGDGGGGGGGDAGRL